MANALFAFDDRSAGEQAAGRLRDELGLAPSAVALHVNESADEHPVARGVDEQVSGGLFTNVLDLFQGIFEWGDSPHDASTFEETVRRGGAVVSVIAVTPEEQAAVDSAMAQAPCVSRTNWSSAPQRSDRA